MEQGSGRTVRREVQFLVQPMEEASGGDATRATTQVPLSQDEAKIHHLRVLQFGGTADGSLLLKNEVVDVSEINATTGAFYFDFEELKDGGDITVYLIANVANESYLPTLTVKTTTLKEFKESTISVFTASESSMQSAGLPMLASGAFDPATTAGVTFKLKSLLAKVVFSFDTATNFKPGPFSLALGNLGNGVTVTENTPGNAAVRPADIGYVSEDYPTEENDYDGTTPMVWYITENLAGRNTAITKDEDRGGANVPADASYWELYNNSSSKLSSPFYKFYLGDGTLTDFNIVRHHQYTMHVTLKGGSATDKRVTLETAANCYIVDSSNYPYSFLATVMGNGAITPAGTNAPEIVPAPLHPVTAKVLWEQSDPTGTSNAEGDVIKLNSVKVVDDTYIQFTTGTKPGNAVIGAFDADGDLIWSWHIWRPESNVSIVTCHTTANGGRDFYMMDRNLGAFNNNVNDVKAYGLLYQWGRKDPFPGATEVTYDDADVATFKGVIEENGYHFVAVPTLTGITVQGAVQTPMNFYYDEEGIHSDDWLQNQNNNLWGNLYTQNVYPHNPDLGSKSIYDPCPPGYRVPPQDTWSQVRESNSPRDTNGYQLGVGTGAPPAKYFYPAAGLRWGDSDMGKLSNVGTRGFYWASSPGSYGGTNAGSLYFGEGGVGPESSYSRAYGMSVRCARE